MVAGDSDVGLVMTMGVDLGGCFVNLWVWKFCWNFWVCDVLML